MSKGTASAVRITEFYNTLGIGVSSAGEGRAIVALGSVEGLRNSRGEVHGGVVVSLADIAATTATRTLLREGDSVATLSISMNFVRPTSVPAEATATVVEMGGRTASVQIAVESGGRTSAHGVATVRLFRTHNTGGSRGRPTPVAS